MVYSVFYRRPAYIGSTRDSTTSKASLSGDSISNSSTLAPAGIPDALSFDRIIAGGTCPVSQANVPCGFFALLSADWLLSNKMR